MPRLKGLAWLETLSTNQLRMSISEGLPGTGVEPARAEAHQPLKLARLPIPPPGLIIDYCPRLREDDNIIDYCLFDVNYEFENLLL